MRDVSESLARLIEAGVSLIDGLSSLAEAAGSRLEGALRGAAAALDSGSELADAMAAQPAAWDRADVELARAGARTGHLAEAFRRMAARRDKRLQVRRRLLKAALYPLILLTASVFILPLPSLILGSAADYALGVVLDLAIIGAALAGIFWGVPWLAGHPRYGPGLRRWAWRLPWPGSLYVLAVQARFTRTLATHLDAGLALPTSLRSAAAVTLDPVAREGVEATLVALDAGATLTAALKPSGLLGPSAAMVMVAAERSGTLVESLQALSDDVDVKLTRGLQLLLTLIGVLLTLAIFAYVVVTIFAAFGALTGEAGSTLEMIEGEIEREMPYIRRIPGAR